MIISMQNEYFNRLSFGDSLKKVNEFGLNFVECSVLWFRETGISEAKKLLSEHGVELSAVNTWNEKQSLEAKKDYVLEGIRMAGELAAKYVIVYFGNLLEEPTIELFKEFITPCLLEAEKNDVILGLETEFDASGKDLTRRAKGCLEIFKAVSSDRLKLNYDPGNIYIAGEEPYPYAYQMLKEHIAYVHLKDAVKYDPFLHGSEEENLIFEDISGKYICVSLGKGAINYEDFMEALNRDNYQGVLTLEPHVVEKKLDQTYRAGLDYARNRLKGI